MQDSGKSIAWMKKEKQKPEENYITMIKRQKDFEKARALTSNPARN